MNTMKQRDRIFKVLHTLREWNEPILKTELVMLIEENNYSYLIGLLDGLCFGGFIHYDTSDFDARLCWITISDNGLNLLRLYDEIPF